MYNSTKIIGLGSVAFRQHRAKSKSRFLHGYQLTAKIWFKCDELDEDNWVIDYDGLKELKQDLLTHFDHKLIISGDDPCKDLFKDLHIKDACQVVIMENGVGAERFAEEVCKLTLHWVQKNRDYVKRNVLVDRVEVFEHANNSAIFINDKNVNIVDQVGHPYLDNAKQKDVPGSTDSANEITNEEMILKNIQYTTANISNNTTSMGRDDNAAPLYNEKTNPNQQNHPAPLRSSRDKSLAEILAGN